MLPGVAEVMVLARILFPVSGLLTVTEKVTVTTAPTARFPVQVRSGLVKRRPPPAVACRVAVVYGIIEHPGQWIGERRPGIGRGARYWSTVTV